MHTVLVTGSDTGIGKTHVVAALARLLGQRAGARIQIVKVVETGRSPDTSGEGDANHARILSGAAVEAVTLASFPAALSPPAAAAAAGGDLSLESLVTKLNTLAPCDWRILEGAGGIATPVDSRNHDWVDFAAAASVDTVILVVPDRLGAINQGRLASHWVARENLRVGVWLNASVPVDAVVSAANRAGLHDAGIPVWAVQAHGALLPHDPEIFLAHLTLSDKTMDENDALSGTADTQRWASALAERDRQNLRRTLQVTEPRVGGLNLADNDYLSLAHDPAVAAEVFATVADHGTSASASPLITGWKGIHAELVDQLGAWHGFPCGLLWSSGYAANSAVLGTLPAKGDLVLADRLIHHSMIAGMLRSGATLKRHGHLQLDHLEELLAQPRPPGRQVFVATESVYSMEGDLADLARMAELKKKHGFFWILDEAHALGWYGPAGAGLARAAGVEQAVDVFVGTLGKALASGGAYSLFRSEAVRDYLVNLAGEFIYSTSLPPTNVAAALAALSRVRELAPAQLEWQAASRKFRVRLQQEGWAVPAGDSPIVPVRLDDAGAAVLLAAHLRRAGVLTAAVRPPTVPAGTSRLRLSLKRTFGDAEADRVLALMNEWRARS